jgi:hypothetical protein
LLLPAHAPEQLEALAVVSNTEQVGGIAVVNAAWAGAPTSADTASTAPATADFGNLKIISNGPEKMQRKKILTRDIVRAVVCKKLTNDSGILAIQSLPPTQGTNGCREADINRSAARRDCRPDGP